MFNFFVEQILGMQWLNDLVWQVLVNYFNADKKLIESIEKVIYGSSNFRNNTRNS